MTRRRKRQDAPDNGEGSRKRGAHFRLLGRMMGFEPTTSGVTIPRSNRMSYIRRFSTTQNNLAEIAGNFKSEELKQDDSMLQFGSRLRKDKRDIVLFR